ncbi:hypothetical protein ACJX0J_008960, partial [Zea mays]
ELYSASQIESIVLSTRGLRIQYSNNWAHLYFFKLIIYCLVFKIENIACYIIILAMLLFIGPNENLII